MHESFGTRLRHQRERRKISLVAIAEQTKIHQPLLEELEHDQVKHWPSGIFRRAFIRAYADAIGLDADEVVREFLTIYPDPIEVVSIGTTLASVASTKQRPPTRLGQFAGAATETVLRTLRRLFGRDDEEAMPVLVESGARPSVSLKPARDSRADEVDLFAAANVCGKLAAAEPGSDVRLLLQEAARIVRAVGVIVWGWNPEIGALMVFAADGYSERVLAQLPKVRRDSDNATAAAFRSGQTCAVAGGERATSALAVPVNAPGGCVGVLAVELPNGAEKTSAIRAVVTMVAAQLGRLIDPEQLQLQADRYPQSARKRA